jgi:hypothetical protein
MTTTMIYTQVLNELGMADRSPLDGKLPMREAALIFELG